MSETIYLLLVCMYSKCCYRNANEPSNQVFKFKKGLSSQVWGKNYHWLLISRFLIFFLICWFNF